MARKFIFKLQPVLIQRERIEQEHQLRVAELETQKRAVEDRLRALQMQMMQGRQEMRQMLGVQAPEGASPLNIPEVRLQAGASIHLVAKAQQTALELAGAYKRVELARGALLKAATARKAVELLREKAFEEWRLALEKKDAAMVDEIGTMQHVRKGLAL